MVICKANLPSFFEPFKFNLVYFKFNLVYFNFLGSSLRCNLIKYQKIIINGNLK